MVRYDDDLWDDIKGETSGDFKYSLKPLVLTESQFLAEDFRNAMVRVALLTLLENIISHTITAKLPEPFGL